MSVIRAPFVMPTATNSVASKPLVCYVVGNEEDNLPSSEEELKQLVEKLVSPVTEGETSFPDLHCVNQAFFIAILWLCEDEPAVDLWCFSEIASSNPEVRLAFCVDSDQSLANATCGDSLIILGLEEAFRRSCISIQQFASGPRPQLPDYLIGWK